MSQSNGEIMLYDSNMSHNDQESIGCTFLDNLLTLKSIFHLFFHHDDVCIVRFILFFIETKYAGVFSKSPIFAKTLS